MNKDDQKTRTTCRNAIYNRCSNFYWEIMRDSGKAGLEPYTCILWKAKLRYIARYHNAVSRATRFKMDDESREFAVSRIMARTDEPTVTCKDYRPDSKGNCRYYFLEACLLTFPECPGTCDDFLPMGDQH